MASVLDLPGLADAAAPPRERMSAQEYLARELSRTAGKAEYLHGEAIEMTGGTIIHASLIWSLHLALGRLLPKPTWKAWGEAARIGKRSGEFFFYADAVVARNEPASIDTSLHAVVEPVVVFEVLSPSTEAFDRGEKFACYRQFPSLQEYVLLAQDAPAVESFVRQPDGRWIVQFFSGRHAQYLSAVLGISIPLAELYESVLPAEAGGA